MNVTILSMRSGADEVRIHKTGCRDIGHELPRTQDGDASYTLEVASQREAAEEFWGDFIAEGSMTGDDALGYCAFLPCTRGLPEDKP
jgi:hypothetical protein